MRIPNVLSLSGLYLCGHSAGAHLAAMVLSTDWSQYSITPRIKGKTMDTVTDCKKYTGEDVEEYQVKTR